jgi:C-terminus of AA_permease
MMNSLANIWARKSISTLKAEAEERDVQALTTHDGVPLKRTLSAVNLAALGIGAIIGAGIFVSDRSRCRGKRRSGDHDLLCSGCRCPRVRSGLPLDTWIRFGVWLVIGLAVYFFYGTKRSQIAVTGTHPPRAYQA